MRTGSESILTLSRSFSESHRSLKHLLVLQGRDDDGDVNVTPRIGSAFGVGIKHHDLGLAIETRQSHLLISTDEAKGFITAKLSGVSIVAFVLFVPQSAEPSLH